MQTRDSSLYLSDDDLYLLAKGEWYRSYDKMGAHQAVDENGTEGFHFAVWAPQVKSVHVIGEFNNWDEGANPLAKTKTGDVWQGFVPGVQMGSLYKFVIETNSGKRLYKADPYAFFAEKAPGTASRTYDINGYTWSDEASLAKRAKEDNLKSTLNIS